MLRDAQIAGVASLHRTADQAERGPTMSELPRWASRGFGTGVALSLAVHELATNALKHGAWRTETGDVVVEWSSAGGDDGGRRLRFRWSETGGPPINPPGRRGFGSRLIEQGLARELKGDVRLVFAPTGLACLMDAPLV